MVGSVVDLVKFAVTIDGQRPWAQLKPDSFNAMIAEVPHQLWTGDRAWFGFGIEVHDADPSGLHWGHGGAYPGSRTLYFRLRNGVTFAFLFNGDTKNWDISPYTVNSLMEYFSTVTAWPEHDLFPAYFSPRPGASGPAARGGIYSLYGVDLSGPELKVVLRDSAESERELRILYASAGQVNCLLPDDIPEGPSSIVVRRAEQPEGSAPVEVRQVAPVLYAGSTVRDRGGGRYLVLYGTGIRNRASLGDVRVRIRDVESGVLYAGPQNQYAGLDQVNVAIGSLPPGEADVQVVTGGASSASLRVTVE